MRESYRNNKLRKQGRTEKLKRGGETEWGANIEKYTLFSCEILYKMSQKGGADCGKQFFSFQIINKVQLYK